MNFFRKSVILGALLSFAAFPASADQRLIVAASSTIVADMARNVAGDRAEIFSIVKPGADIHEYQPTPSDILRVEKAQLILWNGMGLEVWFEKFLGNVKGAESVVVSEGVAPISIAGGAYDGKPNPHAWMSPADALIYVDNIASALSAKDSANQAAYQANAERYKQEIEATARLFRDRLAGLPESRRVLATSEGAFSYLARDFGLKELYLWPVNVDQQGTPRQMQRAIDRIRAENIPVIFSESSVSAKPAQQVARECDIRYGGILYVDTLSGPEGPVATYLDLLRFDLEKIAGELARE